MEIVLWLLVAPFLAALVLLTLMAGAMLVLSVFGLAIDTGLKMVHAVPDNFESAPTRWSRYFD